MNFDPITYKLINGEDLDQTKKKTTSTTKLKITTFRNWILKTEEAVYYHTTHYIVWSILATHWLKQQQQQITPNTQKCGTTIPYS